MINTSLLKNIDIFKKLTIQEIKKLAKIVNIKKIEKGECLFTKGNLRKEFYVVLSGHIKLSQSSIKNEMGWAVLKSQDFISANALINPKTRHEQNACAVEESEVLVIRGDDYIKLAKNNKNINGVVLSGLIIGLNDRLKHSTNKLVTLYKTGQITSNEEDIIKIAKQTLKAVLSIIKAKKAVFTFINKYKNENSILASEGYVKSSDIAGKSISLKDDKIIGNIILNKGIYRSEKIEDESLFLESIYKMDNALGAPLIFNNKVIGMILLGDKITGNFSINNEILLQLISDQIAGAIYRAEEEKELKAAEELKRIYISN
ncbi:MAG: cyclic nucleotide-binding domain-containing protein [bacterium]